MQVQSPGARGQVLSRLLRSPLARMLYFVAMLVALRLACGWTAQWAGIAPNSFKTMSANLAFTVLAVLPYLLAYWLLARFIERRPLSELGWRKSPHLLWGLLAALLHFRRRQRERGAGHQREHARGERSNAERIHQ